MAFGRRGRYRYSCHHAYIALQLIGMREVIAALGVRGEWPLIAAFIILAAYTY